MSKVTKKEREKILKTIKEVEHSCYYNDLTRRGFTLCKQMVYTAVSDEKTCRYKYKYNSEQLAYAAAKDISIVLGLTLSYYQCSICPNYHLTKQAAKI